MIRPVPRDYEIVAPGRPKLIEEIVVNTHEGRPEDVVSGAKTAEGTDGLWARG